METVVGTGKKACSWRPPEAVSETWPGSVWETRVSGEPAAKPAGAPRRLKARIIRPTLRRSGHIAVDLQAGADRAVAGHEGEKGEDAVAQRYVEGGAAGGAATEAEDAGGGRRGAPREELHVPLPRPLRDGELDRHLLRHRRHAADAGGGQRLFGGVG